MGKDPTAAAPGAWVFLIAATSLAVVAAGAAFLSFRGGEPADGILLSGIAIFSAWMATAIHQFQTRIDEIDEIVREGEERLARWDVALAELRRTTESLRANARTDENRDDSQTVH